VVLLQSSFGLADGSCIEDVTVPALTVGKVTAVRPCGKPKGPQGPWLYDVEFPVRVTLPEDYEREDEDPPDWAPGASVLDRCWFIYDATDLDHLERA
jgi:hypothetical protein